MKDETGIVSKKAQTCELNVETSHGLNFISFLVNFLNDYLGQIKSVGRRDLDPGCSLPTPEIEYDLQVEQVCSDINSVQSNQHVMM